MKYLKNPIHEYTIQLLNSEPKPKNSFNHTSDPLLEISNVNVFYNIKSESLFKSSQFHAVKNINLDIHKNSTIGLVGESGSGKSTLGKAIANLVNFEGKIIFNGKDIKNLTQKEQKKAKRDIQIIFQGSIWITFTSDDYR